MIDYSREDCTSDPEDPYAKGWDSAEDGGQRSDNPYTVGTREYSDWDRGYVARCNA